MDENAFFVSTDSESSEKIGLSSSVQKLSPRYIAVTTWPWKRNERNGSSHQKNIGLNVRRCPFSYFDPRFHVSAEPKEFLPAREKEAARNR